MTISHLVFLFTGQRVPSAWSQKPQMDGGRIQYISPLQALSLGATKANRIIPLLHDSRAWVSAIWVFLAPTTRLAQVGGDVKGQLYSTYLPRSPTLRAAVMYFSRSFSDSLARCMNLLAAASGLLSGDGYLANANDSVLNMVSSALIIVKARRQIPTLSRAGRPGCVFVFSTYKKGRIGRGWLSRNFLTLKY
jgi:hypothetical protein